MSTQSLERGEAIVRMGSSKNDFNIKTNQLKEIENDYSIDIINSVREKYGSPKEAVEKLLVSMLPTLKVKTSKEKLHIVEEKVVAEAPQKIISKEKPETTPNTVSEIIKEKLITDEIESLEVRAHTYLQSMIKKLGQDRNYKASIEYPTKDGGRIDIVLERDGIKIAFEISETNKPTYEVKNIKKCLKAGCIPVVMVSKNKNHLEAIKKLALKELSAKDITLVQFIQPDDMSSLLDGFAIQPQKQEEVVKGFRIVTEFEDEDTSKIKNIKSRLAKLFKKKK